MSPQTAVLACAPLAIGDVANGTVYWQFIVMIPILATCAALDIMIYSREMDGQQALIYLAKSQVTRFGEHSTGRYCWAVLQVLWPRCFVRATALCIWDRLGDVAPQDR